MEIAKLSTSSIRIKSKLGIFAIDPSDGKISDVDAILFLTRDLSQKDLPSTAVIINGPGEYEIKGVKFTGVGKNHMVAYVGRFDSIETYAVKASTLNSTKDLIRECNIAIIEADVTVDQASVAATNASIVVLYGEKSQESVSILGKTDSAPVSKFLITREKLPTEMQVVVIG